METITLIIISVIFLLVTIKKWEELEEEYMDLAAVLMNVLLWMVVLFTLF